MKTLKQFRIVLFVILALGMFTAAGSSPASAGNSYSLVMEEQKMPVTNSL